MGLTLPERVARRHLAAKHQRLTDAEIVTILGDEGLRNLGTRYGKAGVFFGIPGSSRMIAVGRRDVNANVFYILIHREGQLRRPDTRWELYKGVLKSKITEPTLRNWARWAKDGLTTKELRGEARHLWLKQRDEGEETPVVILTGETRR